MYLDRPYFIISVFLEKDVLMCSCQYFSPLADIFILVQSAGHSEINMTGFWQKHVSSSANICYDETVVIIFLKSIVR